MRKEVRDILPEHIERKLSVAEDVIARIKDLLLSEAYPPGSRLPSERELAREMGVSRPSVRHALSTLTQMGVLETRQGSGTTVAATSARVLKAPFELLLLLEHPSVYELYEARELVEGYLAGRAAERRTSDDLVALETALQTMHGEVVRPERMTDPDVDFHKAVAAAAHMPVLEQFINCLHDGIRACIETTRPAVADWTSLYEIHLQIYEAIRQQSATDARRAMILHMAMAIDELKRLDTYKML